VLTMSESAGRANHEHGSVSFLATKWRGLIGADVLAADVMLLIAGLASQ
jgi:hypothetical protein